MSIDSRGVSDGRYETTAFTTNLWSIPHYKNILTIDDCSISTFSPDGKYFAYSNDKDIHIWRLRWIKPLALTNYDDLTYVQKILHKGHLNGKEKKGWQFLEVIIKAKFRFDITLDEKVISLGEYDIEIDS